MDQPRTVNCNYGLPLMMERFSVNPQKSKLEKMNKNFNDSFGPSQTATGVVQNINKGEHYVKI